MRIALIAGFIFLAVTGRLFAEGSLYLNNNNNPEATSKIINLKSEDIKNLSIKDYTIFIFKKKTEALKDIARDDLLVAGACKEVPDGFIRKVISIREDGGRVIIETVEGTIADMLKARLGNSAAPTVARARPDANK